MNIFDLQKLSFMRFIKKNETVDYNRVDLPMWAAISTLIHQGCVARNDNILTYVKDYVTEDV